LQIAWSLYGFRLDAIDWEILHCMAVGKEMSPDFRRQLTFGGRALLQLLRKEN
jgi:hypothetical protein